MAIVLAIEPDRRQAAQLTALVRHQVDAELVIADTTEGALDAIGNRVPDLVLVPALLSPQDDAALAAALRVIAAAAHVRTLTIPVLASGVKHAPAGGMLSKWRKQRAASPEPDGCEPSVFGEQISAYLQEAAAERARLEEDALLDAERIEAGRPTPTIDAVIGDELLAPLPDQGGDVAADPIADEPRAVVEQVWTPVEQSWGSVGQSWTPVDQPWTPDDQLWAVVDPQPAASDEFQSLAAELPQEAFLQAADTASSDEQLIDEPIDESSVDLSSELDGLSEHEELTLEDEAASIYTIAAEGQDTSVFDVFDSMPGILDPPSILEDVEAALDQIAAANLRLEPTRARRRSNTAGRVHALTLQPPASEQPPPSQSDIDSWVPMYLTPGRMWPALEGVPAETAAAHTEQPDWIELVASLRQDLERRRTEPSPATDPLAARPSDGADAKVRRLVKKPRLHVRNPVQDEWGFFDPERCGFSTLLAKLEEITEEEVRG